MSVQTKDVIAEMTRRLVQEFAPEQIILFGSHAWGEPDADSDVDLFVVVKESSETPFQRAVRAHTVLRGLNTPKDVLVETRPELERRQSVVASLENLILKSGRRLYPAGPTHSNPLEAEAWTQEEMQAELCMATGALFLE